MPRAARCRRRCAARGPAAATAAFWSRNRRSRSMQSASSTVSSFRMNTYRPRAGAQARLWFAPNPRRRPPAITSVAGCDGRDRGRDADGVVDHDRLDRRCARRSRDRVETGLQQRQIAAGDDRDGHVGGIGHAERICLVLEYGRERLPVLQDRRGRAALHARARGRPRGRDHGHLPGHPRPRARDPAGARADLHDVSDDDLAARRGVAKRLAGRAVRGLAPTA